MKEGAPRRLAKKVDRYFLRTDTRLARTIARIAPETGVDYANSKRRIKRKVDMAMAIPAAVLVAPAIGVLAIRKMCEDGRWPFFRQERIDNDGKTLNILKIRSMQPNSDNGHENLNYAYGKAGWENEKILLLEPS